MIRLGISSEREARTRVTDIVIHAVTVGADEASGRFIKPDASLLGLDDENAQVWMGDDEVGLAVAGLTEIIVADPLDVVEDEPVVTQLASEGLVEPALGGGFGVEVEENRAHMDHTLPPM